MTSPRGKFEMTIHRYSLIPPAAVVLLLLPALISGCTKKINSVIPNITNTVRVSLSTSGGEGNLDCIADPPGISRNGQFIAFTSKASNIVPNDTNNAADVFYRDMLNRTTTLVSMNQAGTGPGNAASGSPSMSGDGRYVAFISNATNLTSDAIPVVNHGGLRPAFQVFIRDMVAATTTLVSRASNLGGAVANDDCNNPRISDDGTCIVFDTTANNLDIVNDGPPDALSDIYRRQWLDAADKYPTILVSYASGFDPTSLSASPTNKGNGNSTNPCLSADGRYVAFASASTNLVSTSSDGAGGSNSVQDVFVRDIMTFRTVRCSVAYPSAPLDPSPPHGSRSPTISADGQMVSFRSTYPYLHPLAQETNPNIYLRAWNAAPPFTEVLSVHTSGATGGASCDLPTISADGTKIAWQSISSALVNGDSNGVSDIFLRNRSTQETTRQSVSTFGNQLDGPSLAPTYSGDGRYIVFYSDATNAVDDDTNGAADIFLRGPPFR
jgi:Tol biopolymer transport system component